MGNFDTKHKLPKLQQKVGVVSDLSFQRLLYKSCFLDFIENEYEHQEIECTCSQFDKHDDDFFK